MTFLKERTQKNEKAVSFVSADAKCKVSIGQTEFSFAAVSHGKKVILGANETVKVTNHDFSNVSIIPDAVLSHDIPQFQGKSKHQFNNDIDLDYDDSLIVIMTLLLFYYFIHL